MLEPLTLSPLHQVALLLLVVVLAGKVYLQGHMSGKLSAQKAMVAETPDDDPREDVPSGVDPGDTDE